MVTLSCYAISFRELVKTISHARDPLLRGGGKEETMGSKAWWGGLHLHIVWWVLACIVVLAPSLMYISRVLNANNGFICLDYISLRSSLVTHQGGVYLQVS